MIRLVWLRPFLLELLVAISVLPPDKAQSVVFLPLQREGAASLVLDETASTAYILDGGQTGSLVGHPVIEGQPILKYFWKAGYRNLYIVCSHPHADHLAGLVELVRYRSQGPEDIDLTQFDKVLFVDSD